MRIKKGDMVTIIAGKDKGKSGKVMKVYPVRHRVSIEGINVYKKHVRPRRQGEKGEVIEVTRSLQRSNVMLVCSSCSKPVRVGYKREGKKPIRYCKKCNATF